MPYTSQNKSPAVVSLLSDIGTPVSVFHQLSQQESTAFLFESTEGDSRLARYSFVGIDPIKTIAFRNGHAVVCEYGTVADNRWSMDRGGARSGGGERRASGALEDAESHGNATESAGEAGAPTKRTIEVSNPLEFLKGILEEARASGIGGCPDLPFSGGLVGYLGYGATRYFENIPQQEADPLNVPIGYYGLYDSVIVFDHQYRRIKVVSHRGMDHARSLVERLTAPSVLSPLPDEELSLSDSAVFDGVTGPFTAESFVELVEKSKQYIREGQVFQIVVSQRFSLPLTAAPLDVYRILQALNPSPYAYLLKCPGFAYLGSSPETFVKCQNGRVILRALAGTRPRGSTEEEDARLAKELRSDEKELAEHRMLVDLGRNDLGRICQAGTVQVGEIAVLAKYTHVMHLATEISGTLAGGKTSFDAFQSCFPRGTVSGAPKIRAMQLLSHLEPEQRGVYSGVVGYFDFAGNMDGAIAIRSALLKDGAAHVNAGAGVVFDSKAEAEYEETRNKARSVIKAIKLAERTASSGEQ